MMVKHSNLPIFTIAFDLFYCKIHNNASNFAVTFLFNMYHHGNKVLAYSREITPRTLAGTASASAQCDMQLNQSKDSTTCVVVSIVKHSLHCEAAPIIYLQTSDTKKVFKTRFIRAEPFCSITKSHERA